jgi:mycofactocin glycosyltransferase
MERSPTDTSVEEIEARPVGGSETKGSLSVVIPSKDRVGPLARVLRSLDDLVGRIPEEVLVVLAPSSDDSPRLLEHWKRESHRFEARVIFQEKASGPGQARNLGLVEARGESVAFTDDDCIVDPHWLEHLPRRISPEKGVVGTGGRVLPLRGDWISRYYTYYRILEPPPSLLYLVTANCAFLRQVALRVGGFDGRIPTPGGEDVALSIRLQLAGWRFEYEPLAVVTHEFRSNIPDFIRTFRNYGKGCREATDRIFGSVPS